MTYCILNVLPNVPITELGSDDRSVPGIYAIMVEGSDVAHPRDDDDPIIESAKDIFHDAIPIDNLDDFEFEFTKVDQATQVPADARWLTAADSVLFKPIG